MTDTLRAIEEAIQAHIALHYEGSLVDSWVVVTHSQQIESHDVSNYRIITQETQPLHTDAGLIESSEPSSQESRIIIRATYSPIGVRQSVVLA